MNSLLKSGIIFGSGILTGVGISYITFKTYYETKADNEITSCKQMYHDREAELLAAYGEITGNSIENGDIRPNDVKNELTDTTTSLDIKEAKKGPEIDYSGCFKQKEEGMKKKELTMCNELGERIVDTEVIEAAVDPAETESPSDDEEMDDDEDADTQEDYDMYMVNLEHQKAVAEGRRPYEIDPGDFGCIPGYETMELFYFQVDDVLVDEDHEEVDIPDIFVGDVLDMSGFKEDDTDEIYIRTDTEMIDVRVEKNKTDKYYSE